MPHRKTKGLKRIVRPWTVGSVCQRRRFRIFLPWLGLLLPWIRALPTEAHGVLVSRGQAVVAGDAMTIELVVDAEDFLHLYGVEPNRDGRFVGRALADSARRYSRVLESILAVYSAEGTRLPGHAEDPVIDWAPEGSLEFDELRRLRAQYTLTYPLPAGTRFLTFQLVPLDEGLFLPLQVVLQLRTAGRTSACTVRLTSGGNAESIEVQIPAAPGGPVAIRKIEHLKEILAEIRAEDRDVFVNVAVPIPLLETFLPLARHNRQILLPSELHAALPEITRLLTAAFAVRAEGRDEVVRVVDWGWLALGEAELQRDRPIHALTGRFSITFLVRQTTATEPPTLRWSLFNPVVLSVAVTCHWENGFVRHVLTTYAPEMTIPLAGSR